MSAANAIADKNQSSASEENPLYTKLGAVFSEVVGNGGLTLNVAQIHIRDLLVRNLAKESWQGRDIAILGMIDVFKEDESIYSELIKFLEKEYFVDRAVLMMEILNRIMPDIRRLPNPKERVKRLVSFDSTYLEYGAHRLKACELALQEIDTIESPSDQLEAALLPFKSLQCAHGLYVDERSELFNNAVNKLFDAAGRQETAEGKVEAYQTVYTNIDQKDDGNKQRCISAAFGVINEIEDPEIRFDKLEWAWRNVRKNGVLANNILDRITDAIRILPTPDARCEKALWMGANMSQYEKDFNEESFIGAVVKLYEVLSSDYALLTSPKKQIDAAYSLYTKDQSYFPDRVPEAINRIMRVIDEQPTLQEGKELVLYLLDEYKPDNLRHQSAESATLCHAAVNKRAEITQAIEARHRNVPSLTPEEFVERMGQLPYPSPA